MELRSVINPPLLLALSAGLMFACSDDPAAEPELRAIPEVAEANGFTTLTAAIDAAGLKATLQGEGPFTVFAPTDAAFDALPEGALEGLLADKDALAAVLTYHVVAGRVDSAQVVNLSKATTVNGAELDIRVEGSTVYINEAKVTLVDVEAKNGIIHVIDAVLLPPAEEDEQNIVEIAAANPDFTTLVAAVQAAGLAETLSGPGPFTVFAPTNAAFDALPAGTVEALLNDIPALTDILTYHVVEGRVDSTAVAGLSSAKTINGKDISIRIDNGSVYINDAKVTLADIQAENGIIHVIDAVLLPPEAPAPGTIVEIAVGNPDFSTLVTAVQAAGLVETLSGPGPFTVFAPTNAAFAALPAGALEGLLADIPALTKILTYHVVSGANSSADVVAASSLTSVAGPEIAVQVSGNTVQVAGATITMVDIQASNGVIHVIDAVIIPPTIADLAVGSPDLSTLVTALQAANLVETMAGPGPFTVFAPINSAFAALPMGTLDGLLQDTAALSNVLTYHVVAGEYRAEDVIAETSLETLQGQSITITTDANGVKVDGANVIATDIIGANGVVHLIDAVILPQ